ncbi:MAG: hypothetical protein WC162_06455 [Sphaerochaetaceae bacterium]
MRLNISRQKPLWTTQKDAILRSHLTHTVKYMVSRYDATITELEA